MSFHITPIHQTTPNEWSMFGYVALTFGPQDAVKLFNKYLSTRGDLNVTPTGIQRYSDRTYRSISRPDVILDYYVEKKGTVVRQGMWQPRQSGDVHRHVRDANLLLPVYFINTGSQGFLHGVEMSYVMGIRPGMSLDIRNATAHAPLGGLATTHFCLKWPGYNQEFRKQVEIKDGNRLPITMSKLVERIARFVQHFIEEASAWPIDPQMAHWRVGSRGGITKDHLYIVGLVHVSAGCWQPVLQLKGMNFI